MARCRRLAGHRTPGPPARTARRRAPACSPLPTSARRSAAARAATARADGPLCAASARPKRAAPGGPGAGRGGWRRASRKCPVEPVPWEILVNAQLFTDSSPRCRARHYSDTSGRIEQDRVPVHGGGTAHFGKDMLRRVGPSRNDIASHAVKLVYAEFGSFRLSYRAASGIIRSRTRRSRRTRMIRAQPQSCWGPVHP